MIYFSYFFTRKQDLTFHANETICIKCQILFFRKNKKNITNVRSTELSQESGECVKNTAYQKKQKQKKNKKKHLPLPVSIKENRVKSEEKNTESSWLKIKMVSR